MVCWRNLQSFGLVKSADPLGELRRDVLPGAVLDRRLDLVEPRPLVFRLGHGERGTRELLGV